MKKQGKIHLPSFPGNGIILTSLPFRAGNLSDCPLSAYVPEGVSQKGVLE